MTDLGATLCAYFRIKAMRTDKIIKRIEMFIFFEERDSKKYNDVKLQFYRNVFKQNTFTYLLYLRSPAALSYPFIYQSSTTVETLLLVHGKHRTMRNIPSFTGGLHVKLSNASSDFPTRYLSIWLSLGISFII